MAQPQFEGDKPVLMEADKLGYDKNQRIVVAIGNVEVAQGESILLADRLTYYQDYNIVKASGNVSLMEPDGNVYFAEEVQLKDDMRAGVVNQFRARLVDNSAFAAAEARRINEDVTVLRKAVYSPCKLCKGEAPFWQLKADKVKVDNKEQRVTYDDAYLEVKGVPIAYTPYFSHATPDADRTSGFLRPEYSQDSNLGSTLKVPYYVNIAPNMDATVTPFMTTEEGLVMEGEYRYLTDRGTYQFNGSGTLPKRRDAQGRVDAGREFRGHIFAKGQTMLDEYWSWGFDVERSTDDTYLRRYDYGNQDTLTSRLYVEGVDGRNYAIAQGLAFQGLEIDDDPDRTPLVAPYMRGYYETEPGWNGSRFFTEANAMALSREVGPDNNHLSMTGGWKLPVVTSNGQLIELEGSVRGDVYEVDDVALSNNRQYSGSETRVIPQLALKWRYPLVKQTENGSVTLEPTVLAVASTSGNNPQEIPNEDNLVAEFTDTNLFDVRRYPGYDTIDDGSRVTYGMRSQWMFDGSNNIDVLFGQNYSFDNTPFPYNDELDEAFSDYIGRVSLDYQPVQLSYRFRLDQEDMGLNRNEIMSTFNVHPVALSINYLSLDEDPFLSNREEVSAATSYAISENWTFNASGRRDLMNDRSIYASTGLTYKNECITLISNLSKDFTRDRDIEPDTSFTVRVLLRNIN